MKISQKGVDFIKKWEGFSDHVYICPAGYKTIGYGTLWKEGMPETCTEEQAQMWLEVEIAQKEAAVNKYITVPLNQPQFDALVSFTYNLGTGALEQSTLRKKLNAKDYVGASNEFPRWVYAGKPPTILPGLVSRRNEERDMFLEPAPVEVAQPKKSFLEIISEILSKIFKR